MPQKNSIRSNIFSIRYMQNHGFPASSPCRRVCDTLLAFSRECLTSFMSDHDNHPFIDDYLPALLAQASHLISDEFHKTVRKNGVSVTEWRVLATLYGAGEISIGSLADMATTKQPTVTRLLDRLEVLGHVQRVAHATDGRVTLVRITDPGKKLIASLIKQAKKHEDQVMEDLMPGESKALKETLRRLIAHYR